MYQIKDWRIIYENNKSRERDTCSFVCLPNGQGGMGFNRIMAEPDGRNIYGIFCLMAGACSRQRVRDGYLTVDGLATSEPLTAEDMALMWRASIGEIQRALYFLSSPKVGWITEIDSVCETSARRVPAECPPGALKEGKKEEKEGSEISTLGDNDLDKPAPVEIDPIDRWKLERLEPWARRLATCCGTLGAKTWQIYKAIVDRYGIEQTDRVARNMIGKWKWPDDLAKILSEIEPGEEVPAPKPLSWQSLEAIRIYETQGPEVVRRVLQWHDVEECNIRYGLEDKENAEYLLANMPKAAV